MNTIKTTFLMALMIVLLIFVGNVIGGREGATIAFGFALIFNFLSYYFSDRIVLAAYGAREVTREEIPWLHDAVGELSRRAGIPMPRLFVIDSPQPNAFATGRNPSHAAVAVNRGLLNLMNREEVVGVLAHELSHILHRDTLISMLAAAFAGAIMYLASMARWAMFFYGGRDRDRGGGGLLEMLLVAILAPLAALLIQMAISRSREYAADAGAARLTENPLSLASALEKLAYAADRIPMEASPATAHLFIVNPLSGGGVASLFSTHPPIEERIRRLREMAGVVG
ncbi:MAG: protease HtpX [Candidatus Hydrogenedentota bacterium]|nr:MAG: protease HtpX [Candidatus Hydrogenedentota bacterium]